MKKRLCGLLALMLAVVTMVTGMPMSAQAATGVTVYTRVANSQLSQGDCISDDDGDAGLKAGVTKNEGLSTDIAVANLQKADCPAGYGIAGWRLWEQSTYFSGEIMADTELKTYNTANPSITEADLLDKTSVILDALLKPYYDEAYKPREGIVDDAADTFTFTGKNDVAEYDGYDGYEYSVDGGSTWTEYTGGYEDDGEYACIGVITVGDVNLAAGQLQVRPRECTSYMPGADTTLVNDAPFTAVGAGSGQGEAEVEPEEPVVEPEEPVVEPEEPIVEPEEDDDEDDDVEYDWNWEVNQLYGVQEGESFHMDLSGDSSVSGEAFNAIKGKDVDLVLDLGNGLSWTINGQSITSDNIGDIDFGVTLGGDGTIPVEVINNVRGERYYMNVTLAHNGEFGMTAILNIDLDAKNKGLYANLFYYNPTTNKLQFMCADMIDENGMANLTFTHASDYTIIIDKNAMNGGVKSPKTGEEANAMPYALLAVTMLGVFVSLELMAKSRKEATDAER